ncbi:MAG TPA: hypothetical protein VNN25_05370 [Thermoanaerobaculia bacterium]|nr:hypothetical protein [Thermoanaerobaculia bacterium]
MAEVIERPNYYQLQFLGAEDFKSEQAYHRDMRRRHNIGPHRWGIVVGLELVEKPRDSGTGFDVYIQAGMAIDGFGREIFVAAPTKLDSADFQFVSGTLPSLHEVWIAYREEEALPPEFGYGTCESDGSNNRVREDFRIVIDPAGDKHAAIVVDGRPADPSTIPDDESVPYQELPDSAAARWLVRIGTVNWDPQAKEFVTITDGSDPAKEREQLLQGRVYAGIVAEEVLGPNQKLRLRPRAAFAATDIDKSDFAFVEGRMRVKGSIAEEKDIFLEGGKISFQNAAGSDANAALWIQRMGGNSNAWDLRVHIGADTDHEKHRLTVGTGSDPIALSTEKVFFAVRGDDRVEIPTGTLYFGETKRQMMTLYAATDDAEPPYGIGVQDSSLYFRTGGHVYWYRGGAHEDGQGKPGGTGVELLHLDDKGCLSFGSKTRQMLNLWSTSYGIGVQSATLYFRSAFDFRWFRGGSHGDGRGDTNGGTLVMSLDDSGSLFLEGDAVIGRSLTVSGGLAIDGNLVMAKGKAMILDGTRFPIDIRTGEVGFSTGGATSGQHTFSVFSRLPKITGGAFIHVALADIKHDGTVSAPRWSVSAHTTNTQTNDNTFNFTFDWIVDSTHSTINLVSYVAFFIA